MIQEYFVFRKYLEEVGFSFFEENCNPEVIENIKFQRQAILRYKPYCEKAYMFTKLLIYFEALIAVNKQNPIFKIPFFTPIQ